MESREESNRSQGVHRESTGRHTKQDQDLPDDAQDTEGHKQEEMVDSTRRPPVVLLFQKSDKADLGSTCHLMVQKEGGLKKKPRKCGKSAMRPSCKIRDGNIVSFPVRRIERISDQLSFLILTLQEGMI